MKELIILFRIINVWVDLKKKNTCVLLGSYSTETWVCSWPGGLANQQPSPKHYKPRNRSGTSWVCSFLRWASRHCRSRRGFISIASRDIPCSDTCKYERYCYPSLSPMFQTQRIPLMTLCIHSPLQIQIQRQQGQRTLWKYIRLLKVRSPPTQNRQQRMSPLTLAQHCQH